MLKIRLETEADHAIVENVIRQSFYNVYMPGCYEHYLAHVIRQHQDFIPELDFVLERNKQIIGNIMYTKATLIDENNHKKDILTFGPVCILPAYQRQGFGRQLIEYSMHQAKLLGYDTIVILGHPQIYLPLGFQSAKKYHISLENGKFPTAMLVKTSDFDSFNGKKWFYRESAVMNIDIEEALAYDDTFDKMEKKHLFSQDEFEILSHSYIEIE